MQRIYCFFFLLVSSICFSQNSNETIASQFDELYRKSTTYKDYKVVKTIEYNKLKKHVVNSLDSQKEIIDEKNKIIFNNNKEISSLKKELSNTQTDLNTAINVKDNRSVFGIATSKSVFSTVIFVTYSILILLLVFFIYKFKQNLSITKKAVSNLRNVEEEFEEHKKLSLKRFQEVNRKLQDELNRNWKKEK